MKTLEKQVVGLKTNFNLEVLKGLKNKINDEISLSEYSQEDNRKVELLADLNIIFKEKFPSNLIELGILGYSLEDVLDYMVEDPIDVFECLGKFAELIKDIGNKNHDLLLLCHNTIRDFLLEAGRYSLVSFVKGEDNEGEVLNKALDAVDEINNTFKKGGFGKL